MARPHLRRLQLIAHQLVSPQVDDPEPVPAAATAHDEVASFFEQGFLACPGVLSEEHVAALKADTDRYMAEAGFSAQQGADDNFEEAITPRLTQPTLAPVLGGLPSFRPRGTSPTPRTASTARAAGSGPPTSSSTGRPAATTRRPKAATPTSASCTSPPATAPRSPQVRAGRRTSTTSCTTRVGSTRRTRKAARLVGRGPSRARRRRASG